MLIVIIVCHIISQIVRNREMVWLTIYENCLISIKWLSKKRRRFMPPTQMKTHCSEKNTEK